MVDGHWYQIRPLWAEYFGQLYMAPLPTILQPFLLCLFSSFLYTLSLVFFPLFSSPLTLSFFLFSLFTIAHLLPLFPPLLISSIFLLIYSHNKLFSLFSPLLLPPPQLPSPSSLICPLYSYIRNFSLHVAGLLAIYLPLSLICYGLLGDNGVPDNILQAVSGPVVTVAQIFILCHFLFAFAVVINPVNQALEGAFNMPYGEEGCRRLGRGGKYV